jgi:hypothetical protein
LLRRVGGRFAKDPDFMFVAANMVARHDWQRRSRLIVRVHPWHRDALDRVTPADAQGVLDVILRRERYDSLTASGRALYSSVHAVAARVPGMPCSKPRLKARLLAALRTLGPPGYMINFNPADIASPLVIGFGGEEFRVDHTAASATLARRLAYIGKNPVAGARFFEAYMRAFERHFLRFNHTTRTYATTRRAGDPRSAFGTVRAHHLSPETNTRGGLHLHGVIWVEEFSKTQLKHAVENEETRRALLAFLSSVSATTIQGMMRDDVCGYATELKPEHVAVQNTPECLCGTRFDVEESTADARQQDGDWWKSRAGLRPAAPPFESPASLPPLPPAGDYVAWRTQLLELVADLQRHCHSSTCFKRSKKHCRLRFPNRLLRRAVLSLERGVQLARDRQMLCPFHEGLLVAARCNMAVLVVGEGRVLDEPTLQRGVIVNALHAATYIVKYVVKDDEAELHDLVRTALAGYIDNIERNRGSQSLAAQKLSRTCTSLQRLYAVSGPHCYAMLTKMGDFSSSYDVVPVPIRQALAFLRSARVNAAPEGGVARDVGGRGAKFDSAFARYVYRPRRFQW